MLAPSAPSPGRELRPAVPTARPGFIPLRWAFDPLRATIVTPPALNAAKPGERWFPSTLRNHETSAAVAYRSWHGSTFPSRGPPALPAGLAAIIRKHLVSAYPLRDTVVAGSTLSRAEHRQRRPRVGCPLPFASSERHGHCLLSYGTPVPLPPTSDARLSGTRRGPHWLPSEWAAPAALTIATTPALTASGSVGQAVTSAGRSGAFSARVWQREWQALGRGLPEAFDRWRLTVFRHRTVDPVVAGWNPVGLASSVRRQQEWQF